MKLVIRSNTTERVELYRANQLTDQTHREKSWLCNGLEMRTDLFKKIVHEVLKKLKNYEEFAVQKLRATDH